VLPVNAAVFDTVLPPRFQNILDPVIVKKPWTAEEDEAITQLVAILGNKWVAIAKHLPGRCAARTE
jgi:hypothetical protein